MSAETLIPDAILAQAALTGGVGLIDEDPDSSGTDFLTADDNNSNTAVRTSFGTPTANPTVGADLQEFRAQVREFDTGQTGTPQARIELWENGALVRAGSNTNVVGTDQVIAFTWNANELATADGSLVELKVVGTKSGGAPGARNSVEVGAVEWNADVSAGADEAVAGTAAAVASLSGSLTADVVLASTAGAISTLDGTMEAERGLDGSAGGASSLSGSLAADLVLVSTIGATSTLDGVMEAERGLAGSANAVSSLSGTLTVPGATENLEGTAAGVASVSAGLGLDRPVAATAAAASSLSGSLAADLVLISTVGATSTLDGTMQADRGLAGASGATSSLSGTLSADRDLSGVAAAAMVATASLQRDRGILGAIPAVASVNGLLTIPVPGVPTPERTWKLPYRTPVHKLPARVYSHKLPARTTTFRV